MGLTDRQQELADRIRADAAGDVLRLEPDETGFLVVRASSSETAPQLYRVTSEKQMDDSVSLHWELLGPVEEADVDLEADDTEQ